MASNVCPIAYKHLTDGKYQILSKPYKFPVGTDLETIGYSWLISVLDLDTQEVFIARLSYNIFFGIRKLSRTYGDPENFVVVVTNDVPLFERPKEPFDKTKVSVQLECQEKQMTAYCEAKSKLLAKAANNEF